MVAQKRSAKMSFVILFERVEGRERKGRREGLEREGKTLLGATI